MFRKFKKDFKETVVKPVADKRAMMRLNRFLSNKYTISVLILSMNTILILAIHYVVNVLRNMKFWIRETDHLQNYFGLDNLKMIRLSTDQYTLYLYLAIAVMLVILDIKLIYNLRVSFSDKHFNVGQKGKERATTIEEIKTQYKEIPEKDKEYKGAPGSIISRYKDKIYIDDSITNNLYLGMTRSGKGEMFVLPNIDVYSRSSQRPSLVITDPKLELYKSSKKILEKRGYQVYLMNLDDPLHSMGYNPLQLVMDLYEKEDYGNAELFARTFAYAIFDPENQTGNEKYFSSTAADVLTAMILAMIEDALYEHEKYNETRKKFYKKKKTDFLELSKEQQQQEKHIYMTYKEAGKDCISDKNILFLPEEVEFQEDNKYKKQVTMYNLLNIFTELSRDYDPETEKSKLDLYFEQRPLLNRAKFKYSSVETAGMKTKGNVFSTFINKLTIFTYENVAKMTTENTVPMLDVGYGDQPVAIFLGIPDYDSSKDVLATIYIRQLYFMLAKETTKTACCDRPVKFICDEFGNLPPIENMSKIITVCLGRNISFDLYIQSYSQLEEKYGKGSNTIISNCGNQIWIIANDEESAEKFTRLLGNETIIDVQRGGNKLSMEKYYTESPSEHPLLNANQLMRLQEGECVVKRVMKRRDLKGNRIIPYPILNLVETGTQFKYRHEYLQDSFPNPKTIDFNEINNESREHIVLKDCVFNYNLSFKRFGGMDMPQFAGDTVMELEHWNTIHGKLEEVLGEHYQEIYNITEDMTVNDFKIFLDSCIYMDEQLKRAISSLLEM